MDPQETKIMMDRAISVYALADYKFDKKEPWFDKDSSIEARFARMEREFAVTGMRRTVEGVIVTHKDEMAFVLVLQLGKYFKLPGGELQQGEDEVEGLKRLLEEMLGRGGDGAVAQDWIVEDKIGIWWRPNFAPPQFPYIPPHVDAPKEQRTIYLVQLKGNAVLSVPNNHKLVGVPLSNLFDRSDLFGPVISALPQVLSRFDFTFLKQGNGEATTPEENQQ